MQIITARPLTANAFQPFGAVTDFDGPAGLAPFPAPFDCTEDAVQPYLGITRVEAVALLPFRVTRLERHPFSAQTFIPLSGAPSLILACKTDGAGNPDITSLQAFIASGRQCVTYGLSVWHHSLGALAAPAQFIMAMAQTGRNDDNAFFDLPSPIEIREAELLQG